MKRQILASMNEICNELDNLGMIKASSEITEMMVRISQSFMENLKQKSDYDKASTAYYNAGARGGLDPEKFFLFQEYDQDLVKKKQNPRTLSPEEIGRLLAKTNVDVNKLRMYFSNAQKTSAPQSSGKSLFKRYPPLGSRVESGKTEGMTDNELIKDYVELAKRNFEKHDLDKVGYWEDQAKEKLSPGAYAKFEQINEKMHDQYTNWLSEHPDQAAIINARKPKESSGDSEFDPFEKQTSETSTAKPATPTKPVMQSSGLDRWVNKAENIYKAWSDKNMPENSTAPLLIKDVMNYMVKVKNSLPPDKLADAQAKIDKVQSFIDNINNKVKHTGTVAAYSTMTGFGKKESDVFGGQKMDEKKLDYLAKQEAKTY